MNKIEKQLIPGEEIIYQAKVHWWIYSIGVIFIFFGVKDFDPNSHGFIVHLFFIVYGLYRLIRSYIAARSTAYVITNKRVILRYGGFRQRMVDVLLSKATMLQFNQGVIGRMLNFGGVSVSVSGSKCSFPYMKDPMQFRQVLFNEIQQKI